MLLYNCLWFDTSIYFFKGDCTYIVHDNCGYTNMDNDDGGQDLDDIQDMNVGEDKFEGDNTNLHDDIQVDDHKQRMLYNLSEGCR